jgi:hypothetical protein
MTNTPYVLRNEFGKGLQCVHVYYLFHFCILLDWSIRNKSLCDKDLDPCMQESNLYIINYFFQTRFLLHILIFKLKDSKGLSYHLLW